MRTVLLQLTDIFGNVIEEDNMLIEEGDVLICNVHREMTDITAQDVISLQKAIKNMLSGEADNLIVPDYVSFKILKKKIVES